MPYAWTGADKGMHACAVTMHTLRGAADCQSPHPAWAASWRRAITWRWLPLIRILRPWRILAKHGVDTVVKRRKPQTPGTAKEHRRQGKPTINTNKGQSACTPHSPSTRHHRKGSPRVKSHNTIAGSGCMTKVMVLPRPVLPRPCWSRDIWWSSISTPTALLVRVISGLHMKWGACRAGVLAANASNSLICCHTQCAPVPVCRTMMPSCAGAAVRGGGVARGTAGELMRHCWGGIHADTVMRIAAPRCALSCDMHAESLMRIIGPRGRALTNDEAKPWRRVVSNVLSPEVVMSLQVPLMVQDLTTVIRAGAATDEPVRPCSASSAFHCVASPFHSFVTTSSA